ncbi:hypothetical protein JOM56_008561 [Amanita muscaria]
MVPASEPVHSTLLLADPFATPPDTADTIGAGAKVRKPTSMSYFSSGFRDSREKNSKKQRPLVVVIPPTILLHQHGPLGHTLSFGSPQRLAQGIIMTLHPTMYAQLTAISREFNFPSTAGLCLYLHHTENGIILTPRISDESWPSLWGPVLEYQTSATPTVPITGTIEFDIDLRQAKWYSSWLSSSSRDDFGLHHSGYPHTVASERNGDSRTFVSDEQLDDHRDTYIHYPSSSVSLRRRPPKKLSLVDRFDMPNANHSLPSSSPSPEKAPFTIHAVSPIVQESEPRTATKSRVQSWRAGSALEPTPTSMITAGQISLDPANIPNMMQIDVSLEIADVLNLDDYSYSISSAGPKDFDSLVSGGSECRQSIHLEHRLRGSVNSTPSISTSFGPLDYDSHPNLDEIDYVPSPDLAQRAIESVPLTPMTATSWGPPSSPPSPWCRSYAASVDIGDRHIFSPPLSATTATSWGPPLSDPPSPLVVSVPVTPDIGCRAIDDTVAPEPWRYSWLHYLSQMDINSLEPPRSSLDSRSRYPYIKIYASVYPFVDIYPELAGENLGDVHLQTADNWSNRIVSVTLNQYPSFNLYPPLYPFFVIYPTALKTAPTSYESSIAHFCPQSYPIHSRGLTLTNTDLPIIKQEAHHLQFSETLETQPRSVHPLRYPIFDLYPANYPHINLYPSIIRTNCPALSPLVTDAPLASVFSVCSYPTLVIYPPVYPHFDIYPSRLQADIILSDSRNLALDMSLKPGYPTIHPAIYPHFDLYPTVLSLDERSTASASTETAAQDIETVNVRLRSRYPTIVLYPALYPHFDIYPILNGRLADLTSASILSYSDAHVTAMTDIRLKPRYPTIILYPALYPHLDLYPMLPHNEKSVDQTLTSNLAYSGAQDTETVDIRLKPGYPTIILYPALYPHLDLYPMLPHNERYVNLTSARNLVYSDAQGTETVDTRLMPGYPTIILYPALYPHFDLYPMLPHNEKSVDQTLSNLAYSGAQGTETVGTRLMPGYPTIILYPALYPHFDLYPMLPHNERYVNPISARNLVNSDTDTVDIRLKPGYPTIILYPALYPHLDLYPMLPHNERCVNLTSAKNLANSDAQGTDTVDIRLKPGYPTIILYPALYPHFDIYPILLFDERPGIQTTASSSVHWDTQVTGTVDLRLKLGYPTISPYPAFYPHFDIYPTILLLEKCLPSMASTTANEDCSDVQIPSVVDLRLKPGYPTILIYSAVYPHFEIYPRIPSLGPLSMGVQYPCFDLYPIVNENFRALATSVNGLNETSSKRRRTKSHRDLHDVVFSNAFVSTPGGSLQSAIAPPLAVHSNHIQTQEEQIPHHILSGPHIRSTASSSEELKMDMFLHRSQAAHDTLYNDDLFVSYV